MKTFKTALYLSLPALLLLSAVALCSCSSVSHGEEAPTKTEKIAVLNVGTFIVNLDLEKNKVLKLTLNAELKDPLSLEAAQKKYAALRDDVLTTVSGHDYDQIRTADGKISLKKELGERFNKILGEAGVNEVYITEFIIN